MSSTECTLKFIKIYRKHDVLWDSNIKDYTNKMKRSHAINDISQKMNMTPVEVKNKIKSLRSYFSKERGKVKNKSGSAPDNNYESTWFGYKPLLFIRNSITPKETKETSTESDIYGEDLFFPEADEGTLDGNRSLNTAGEQEEEECEFRRPIKTRSNLKRTAEVEDQQVFKFLRLATNELTKTDDCSIFGEMVASQLRKLGKRNLAIAKHEINNVLFKMEMDEINRTEHSNPSSPYTSCSYKSPTMCNPHRAPSPLSNPPLTPPPSFLSYPPLVIKTE